MLKVRDFDKPWVLNLTSQIIYVTWSYAKTSASLQVYFGLLIFVSQQHTHNALATTISNILALQQQVLLDQLALKFFLGANVIF